MADMTALATHVRKTFGRLADAPVWVAWRDDGGRKLPINPRDGRLASSTDPNTWVSAGQAMQFAARTGAAGVGIVLGPDPDLNPEGSPDKPWIVGVDYDNALRPDGNLMPWAREFFCPETYAEVSPSGSGVKAFGVVSRRPDGIPTGQDGAKLRLDNPEPAVSGKRPAIEVYCGRRWFAVTGRQFPGAADGLHDIGARFPTFTARMRPAQAAVESTQATDAYVAYATPLSPDETVAARALMAQHDDLRNAMFGADWADRSLALWTAADLAKGYRLGFRAFVHGLMASAGSAGEHVRSQPDALRALARAWDRSPQPAPLEAVPPVAPPPANDESVVSMDLSGLDTPNPLGAPEVLPSDLYANPPPLPPFILDGFFPAAPTAIVGTGGTFKSTIWLSISTMMLLDTPLWNRNWWSGGTAVMLSREDEKPIMLRRLYDLLHAMNVTDRQYHDIIRNRLYLDDMTRNDVRFVEADRSGNLHLTAALDHIIDKYRDRGVSMMAVDPMVNFGPGEVHGNDGAAKLMLAGWALTRGLAGDRGRCCVSYIHHLSMASARDEVEDAHAGRSASAVGDNARAVFVMHRHRKSNKHRHVAPPTITEQAIEAGNVIRMTVAKQSYASRLQRPIYVERVGGAFLFHDPALTPDRPASGAGLTEREQAERDERRGLMLRTIASKPEGTMLWAEFDSMFKTGVSALVKAELFADGEIVEISDGMRRYVTRRRVDYGF